MKNTEMNDWLRLAARMKYVVENKNETLTPYTYDKLMRNFDNLLVDALY